MKKNPILSFFFVDKKFPRGFCLREIHQGILFTRNFVMQDVNKKRNRVLVKRNGLGDLGDKI